MSTHQRGKVYLTGAGPGDPQLMTARSLELLKSCDVIVYDESVEPQLLRLAHPRIERVYVGSISTFSGLQQDRINQVLLEKSSAGKRVLRLRGGDACLMGESTAEALFCQSAGIDFELVPGVNQSSAAAAASGIPLLQSGLAGTVLITRGPYEGTRGPADDNAPIPLAPAQPARAPSPVRRPGVQIRRRRKDPEPSPSHPAEWRLRTPENLELQGSGLYVRGEESEQQPAEAQSRVMNWKALARAAETLVFLEAEKSLDIIGEGLMHGGRPAAEPVALISRGTTPRQNVLITTLRSMAADSKAKKAPRPFVVVVGDVVNLREFLGIYEQRPLFGRTIALIQGGEGLHSLANELSDAGAHVLETDLLECTPLAGLEEELGYLVDDLRLASHVVFSEPYAVDAFFRALDAAAFDVRLLPAECRLLACGSATVRRLEERGLRCEGLPPEPDEDAMAPFLRTDPGTNRIILLGRVGKSPHCVTPLRHRGVRVTTVPLFDRQLRKGEATDLRSALFEGRIHAVVFGAALVVDALKEQWGEGSMQKLLGDVLLGASDAETQRVLEGLGLKVGIPPSRLHADVFLGNQAVENEDKDEPTHPQSVFVGDEPW